MDISIWSVSSYKSFLGSRTVESFFLRPPVDMHNLQCSIYHAVHAFSSSRLSFLMASTPLYISDNKLLIVYEGERPRLNSLDIVISAHDVQNCLLGPNYVISWPEDKVKSRASLKSTSKIEPEPRLCSI